MTRGLKPGAAAGSARPGRQGRPRGRPRSPAATARHAKTAMAAIRSGFRARSGPDPRIAFEEVAAGIRTSEPLGRATGASVWALRATAAPAAPG